MHESSPNFRTQAKIRDSNKPAIQVYNSDIHTFFNTYYSTIHYHNLWVGRSVHPSVHPSVHQSHSSNERVSISLISIKYNPTPPPYFSYILPAPAIITPAHLIALWMHHFEINARPDPVIPGLDVVQQMPE